MSENKQHIPTAQEINAQRKKVRRAYAAGDGKKLPSAYQREFDKLQSMNKLFMAAQYRNQRGLPPSAKTPYCER